MPTLRLFQRLERKALGLARYFLCSLSFSWLFALVLALDDLEYP